MPSGVCDQESSLGPNLSGFREGPVLSSPPSPENLKLALKSCPAPFSSLNRPAFRLSIWYILSLGPPRWDSRWWVVARAPQLSAPFNLWVSSVKSKHHHSLEQKHAGKQAPPPTAVFSECDTESEGWGSLRTRELPALSKGVGKKKR